MLQHTFSLCLLITTLYQVPTDNILIRSLIQWDFFRTHWIRAILLSFYIYIYIFRSSVYLKLKSLSASVIKIYTNNPIFFHEGGFLYTHESEKKNVISRSVELCKPV